MHRRSLPKYTIAARVSSSTADIYGGGYESHMRTNYDNSEESIAE